MKLPLTVVACLFAGCGGSAATTPEAALKKALEAAQVGNASDFRAAFVSDEELGASFDCEDRTELVGRYDGLSDEFVAWRDARPTLTSLSVAANAAIAPGDAVGHCKARRALKVVRADVHLNEKGTDTAYAMRFVELDGVVRVLGF